MADAHELARGHKRLRALIEFAVAEGWHVNANPIGPSQIHPARFCADLYQLDRERLPGQPERQGTVAPGQS